MGHCSNEIHSLEAKIDAKIQSVFTSRKLSQILSVKENKLLIVIIIITHNALDIHLSVICALQIYIAGTLPDTYINASVNIGTLPLVKIL